MILHVIALGDAGTREAAPMDLTNRQQAEREEHRAYASRDELVEHIARAMRDDRTATPLDGLMLRRPPRPRGWCMVCLFRPSV